MSVKNLSVTNDRNWIQSTYFDKGVGYCLKMCLFSEENKEFWYQWYLYTFIYFYLFFSYSCHTFFPITHPHLIHPDSHSQSSPLSGPMSPLLIFLCLLLPLLSPTMPSPPLSGHIQFILYFQVSGSILLICLICWLGSTYKWDHMVFVFPFLAYFT